MHDYLGHHPDIFMAQKEMHYFGRDLGFCEGFYRRDERAYLEAFRNRNGHRLAGESSVWYLFSRSAAAEIKAFNPEARVVIMLRNPVDMVYSLYHQFRYDANEDLPTFDQALAAEPKRRAGSRLSRQTYFPQGLAYRETALYAAQVKRYFDTMGRERVHVVLYDDFAHNPAAAYRGTVAFLGLRAPGKEPAFERINSNKTVRSRAVMKVLRDPLLRSSVTAACRKLPRPCFVCCRRLAALVESANARPERRRPLAPELRAKLARDFAPDVERLSSLLKRDLTHWTRINPDPHSP
jgi:hypothetical protein